MRLIIILLLFMCAVAQDTITVYKDGTSCQCDFLRLAWYDYEEPNDTLMMETPFLKGELNGTQKQYYRQGYIMGETVYKNGWAEGLSYAFDTLGNLTLRSTFHKGKYHGEVYTYDAGIPIRLEIYRNDTLISSRACKVRKDLMNDNYCP